MTDPRRHIGDIWTRVHASMKKLQRPVDIRPNKAVDIFKQTAAPAGRSCFDVKPVVFKLPEKPSHSDQGLFVVVSGSLEFEPPVTGAKLRTKHCSTQIAYFKAKREVLDHVCGIHYDLDDQLIAHPVFHAQLTCLGAMRADVENAYHLHYEPGTDFMKGVIPNVRIPTAQMDFFSVALQLCADHLVNSESDAGSKNSFQALRTYLADSIAGACGSHAGLVAASRAECYRAPYWYLDAVPAVGTGRP